MDILPIVLKTCQDTLELVRYENDPILNSMSLYVYNNLGIRVDVSKSKYAVLESIRSCYLERLELINDNGLTPLYEKLNGIDRNTKENLEMIKTFILDNYKITVDEALLSPYMDKNEIIDSIINIIRGNFLD